MMWIVLVLALVGMSVLTVIQTPIKWWRRRLSRILLIVYHAIGITSIFLILFVVCRMRDGFLREVISWTETVYFTLTVYALLLSVVRYFGFEIARHFRHRKILNTLNSSAAFLFAVLFVSAVYMIPAVYNATNLRTVTYDVQVEKSCGAEELSVVVVSDFHMGAGARHAEMDQMAELLCAANPDVILIAGDICDSSSSADDLVNMEEILKKTDCRYGIFYVEGNHEAECRTDPAPYLMRAGVTILRDEGVRLENGVNIVGRKNALKTSVGQIMKTCKLDSSAPTLVLQHRANGFSRLEGVADVVVCGHTHGYPFPFTGLMMPYFQEVSYGQREYGNMSAIVTSGVSEWGYRAKWPSQSEIAVINISFREIKQ